MRRSVEPRATLGPPQETHQGDPCGCAHGPACRAQPWHALGRNLGRNRGASGDLSTNLAGVLPRPSPPVTWRVVSRGPVLRAVRRSVRWWSVGVGPTVARGEGGGREKRRIRPALAVMVRSGPRELIWRAFPRRVVPSLGSYAEERDHNPRLHGLWWARTPGKARLAGRGPPCLSLPV